LLFAANANQVEFFAAGMELNEECWNNDEIRCVGLRLAEKWSRNRPIAGNGIADVRFFIYNARFETSSFRRRPIGAKFAGEFC
jgi:hypothetical protein